MFCKMINENGETVMLLKYDFRPNITDLLVVEITQEEYETILAEIEAANHLEEPTTDEVSAEEVLDIIIGGEGV